jgi:hypothetical protein
MLALSYMQYLPRCARSSDTRLGVSQKKHRSRRLVEACVRGAFGVGRGLRVYPPERRPRTPACPRTLRAPEIAPLAGAAHPVARLDGGRGAAPKPQRRRRRQSRGQEPRGATSDITRVERGLRQPDQPPCGGACRHMRTVRGPAASGLRSLRPRAWRGYSAHDACKRDATRGPATRGRWRSAARHSTAGGIGAYPR